jgi:hypothetical protein
MGTPAWLRFAHALRDPAAAQHRILRRTLQQNAGTDFGQRHSFDRIATVEDYRSRVPLRTYDDYAPFIRRVEDGHPNVLTRQPVRFVEPTGGSSQASKLIPYTASLMQEFSAATLAWIFDLLAHRPGLRNGRAYWASSPPVSTGTTAGGLAIGMTHERDTFPPLARSLLRQAVVGPSSTDLLDDPENWREVTLRSLFAVNDLALISVWSPSFLTLLLDGLDAREIRHRWPRLDLISCWADGHAARAVQGVRRLFPEVEVQGKGLLATEGVVSVPLLGVPAPVAAVTSHFLEFLPEGDPSACFLVHELDPGATYEVALSTGGGLYRYRLRDLVRVEGYLHRTPMLRFAGRADGASDLAGEKLTPALAERAITSACRELGIAVGFAMLAPAPKPPGYILYTDAGQRADELALEVDRHLRESHHYNLCRTLGQLAALRAIVDPAAERTYERVCRRRGQRAGNIKPKSLDAAPGWEREFSNTMEAVS